MRLNLYRSIKLRATNLQTLYLLIEVIQVLYRLCRQDGDVIVFQGTCKVLDILEGVMTDVDNRELQCQMQLTRGYFACHYCFVHLICILNID